MVLLYSGSNYLELQALPFELLLAMYSDKLWLQSCVLAFLLP